MRKEDGTYRLGRLAAVVCAAVAVVLVVVFVLADGARKKQYTANGFAMNTLITQSAYGPGAQQAMLEVNEAFAAYEERLSLFGGGDIARVNAAAGEGGADISPETEALLRQALALSGGSEGAFAVTIAPVTLAWGVTGSTPRVVPPAERQALLPLVNDDLLVVEAGHATLEAPGMGIDLGGIAKGAACGLAAEIYERNGVDSALLSIGGNIYARGVKPDGSAYRVGFRNPEQGSSGYLASFEMTDKVVAISGGYERFFEVEGERYIHIFDPRTASPAQSDVVAVGVVDPDGAVADFYSTTLFVWGVERTLAFMRAGGEVILLDGENNLYVSESLRESFQLHDEDGVGYNLVFVAAEG